MEIRDNGHGFAPEGTPGAKKTQRLGLLGMRERIEMVGGTLQLISSPGQPTTVRAEFPASGAVTEKRVRKNRVKIPSPPLP